MKATAPALLLTDLPADPAATGRWSRFVYSVVALMAAAGVFACWCDAPMIWDGAYQFSFSLILQKPYSYLTRFHSVILWTPMVLLTHLTQNLAALKLAYGLPFTLAPATSVFMSWCVVRRAAPHLIVWAVFGAAIAPLPGQIFIINDSIFQQHMFWPVFLGLLVPLRAPQIVLLSLLVVFQFAHQIGFVLLTGGAGAAVLLAWRAHGRARREFLIKSGVAAALAAIALWKILHFPDSYAQQEFTWERAHMAWQWGVAGYPLRGLTLMWAAGMLAFLDGAWPAAWRSRRIASMLPAVAVALALATMITWTIWARDPRLWSDAVNYRRWVVPLSGPFYLMAFLDAWQGATPGRPAPLPRVRMAIGWLSAGTFALVLAIQCAAWLGMTRRMMTQIEAQPRALVPWRVVAADADGTALQHWGTCAFVYVLEGRQPRHVLLDGEAYEQQLDVLRRGAVPLAPFTPVSPAPGPDGWFDFGPMMRQIQLQDGLAPEGSAASPSISTSRSDRHSSARTN